MAKSQNEPKPDVLAIENDVTGRREWTAPHLQRLEAGNAENVPGSGGDIASFAFAS